MSRVALCVLLAFLIVALPLTSVVEGWSTPVYTKPWTEEEETESEVVEETKEGVSSETIVAPIEEIPLPAGEDEIDEFLLDFESLYGTWYIWTPGTPVGVYNSDGEYVKHNYVQGAAQGRVVIDQDGSYSMSHGAWGGDTVVEGKWRLSYPREINGEVLQAIGLLDGLTDTDWAVAPSPSGKIRLLWAMGWADGSATWIFDSELVRE